MPSIAVVLIVKNEQDHLATCLDSVKDWADQIVILDAGSTDNTQEIALRYTPHFYQNSGWPGFGKQRQIAQTYVSTDYVFWIDADERVTDELKQSILQAVKENQPNTLYQICRLTNFLGKDIKHSGWYPDWVTRLYRTNETTYNDNLVHEKVIIPTQASLKKLEGDLLHFPYKDLQHYLNKSIQYGNAWANQRHEAGKQSSIFSGVVHAFFAFIKMYIMRKGFLDGKQGFLLAVLSSYSTWIKHTLLWEKNHSK